MSRVLIVDDEPSIGWAFREFLADEGYDVEVAASAEEGLRAAERKQPDALILDVRLPGRDGLTALPSFRERIDPAPIIVVTAFGNLDTVARAMEGGAFDYLVKPFDLDQIAAVLKRALTPRGSSAPPDEPAGLPPGPEALIGASEVMHELFKSIALVAQADVPVLITGESGTGKELVARAIHRYSSRRAGPFLPVCLAALSPNLVESELFGHTRGAFTGAELPRKGLLELAQGGTVLLDELGDIPPALQVKLLRAIEHREVTPVGDARTRPIDVRFLAATNRPLRELMADGSFREDLYFRLNVFPIRVPPLRDRREDIPALAEHFLRLSRLGDAGEPRLGQGVLAELKARPWVGNVRELRNAIEHAAILARGGRIAPEHLPAPMVPSRPDAAGAGPDPLESSLLRWVRECMADPDRIDDATGLYERFLEATEPTVLRAALQSCGQQQNAAAELLGIHRATLRQKLRKYGIGAPGRGSNP
jgi:DNA-binding NtrC family response regulator